jgi:hypothetical protein
LREYEVEDSIIPINSRESFKLDIGASRQLERSEISSSLGIFGKNILLLVLQWK